MTWHAVQGGFREVATTKHGNNCSIYTSGLQVPLSAEQKGFMHPASQFVRHHHKICVDTCPGKCSAVLRGLGCRRGFWGEGQLLWALYTSTNDATWFAAVMSTLSGGAAGMRKRSCRGSEVGTVLTCAILVRMGSSSACIQ
jgi:hypothetical protein